MKPIETIIVTRHAGLVAHLNKMGIVGTVLSHATAEDVAGKRVIGVIPLSLASLSEEIGVIDLNLSADQRGRELSEEEVAKAASPLTWYTVRKSATYQQSHRSAYGLGYDGGHPPISWG